MAFKYDCSETWASCPAPKPHCYWGDQGYNKGKCCAKPWSTDCVAPRSANAGTLLNNCEALEAALQACRARQATPAPTPREGYSNRKKEGKGKGKGNSGSTTAGSGSGSWQKATATWYTSYPACCHDKKADQGECADYSGCKYEGMFAAFGDKKQPKEWVEKNNIVAFYESPNSKNRKEWAKKWKNKKIRIRNPKNGNEMDALIVDTCDDGDCNGCCSKNANKNGGYLVDLESNTAKRFYGGKVEDIGGIEWQVI